MKSAQSERHWITGSAVRSASRLDARSRTFVPRNVPLDISGQIAPGTTTSESALVPTSGP